MSRPEILDTCHKYGWAITIVGTAILQIVIWSYTVGSFKQAVDDMSRGFGTRLDRLERQIDDLTIYGPVRHKSQ